MEPQVSLQRNIQSNEYWIESPQQMIELGKKLAHNVQLGCCFYFEGNLGSGKTTLIQGIFSGLHVAGPVLSPTFSIMETYSTDRGLELLHIDLYRIETPQELLLIGLDEFEKGDYAWFIEWPQRGTGVIPEPDIHIVLSHADESRKVKVSFISELGNRAC